MDESQANHLRAYGVTYYALQRKHIVRWLLNYHGGSFLIPYDKKVEEIAIKRGVSYEILTDSEVRQIDAIIAVNNMEVVELRKAPKIAVYKPPHLTEAWDDAVTLVLTYAKIPYTQIWDEQVLKGELKKYDWLHLHHEDFTGQYGKFGLYYYNAPWYIKSVIVNKQMAKKMGFKTVPELKKAVVAKIQEYVRNGGFLFAMCLATDTIDIASAARNTDIVPEIYDGTPVAPNVNSKLDFSLTFAFKNFKVITDPHIVEHSTIDIDPNEEGIRFNPFTFILRTFDAKKDTLSTLLVQNHTKVVKGFLGATTGFHKKYLKNNVIVLGAPEGKDWVNYIYGKYGKGLFTFYAGHDPEDYTHYINDPPTNLANYPNSPGYRLILNNVLFPAAKPKRLKT